MALILPRRRNPLVFPHGVAPGFDPTHPASNKIRLSAVSSGKNFYNVLTGKPGTTTVSASVIDGSIGLSTRLPADFTQYVSFPTTTAPAETPDAQTWGVICTLFSTPAANAFLLGSGTAISPGAGNWFGITTTNLLFNYNWGDGGACSSPFTISLNVPYFLAASNNGTTINFVATNLLTGAVLSSSANVAAGTSFKVTDGGFQIALDVNHNSTSSKFDGIISEVMMNASYVPLASILKWADDPWSFWYPQRRSQSLTVGVTSSSFNIAAAQSIPSFTNSATLAAIIAAGASQSVPVFSSVETLAAYVSAAVAQTLPDFTSAETLSHSTALNAAASQAVPAFADTETLAAILSATTSQTVPNFAAAETLAALVKAQVAATLPDFGQTFQAIVLAARSLTGSQAIPGFPQVVTVSDRKKNTTVYIII